MPIVGLTHRMIELVEPVFILEQAREYTLYCQFSLHCNIESLRTWS